MKRPTLHEKAEHPIVRLQRLHDDAIQPSQGSAGSFGWDLSACLVDIHGRPNTALIPPRSVRTIDTGWALEAPPGLATLILSRSGLATEGLFVANSPGLIDSDYRGEIKIILANLSHNTHRIFHGNRIAQMLFVPMPKAKLVNVETLSPTERGSGGFGSTGL